MMKKIRKAQSILDFGLAFIALALLAVGITRIWVWFNANYAARQVTYQTSRFTAAGTTRNTDAGVLNLPADTFQPYDLNEDWVFKGQVTGQPLGNPLAGGGYLPWEQIQKDCHDCSLNINNDPNFPCPAGSTQGCIDNDPSCPEGKIFCHCPYYYECLCNGKALPVTKSYEDQIKTICGPHAGAGDTNEQCNPGGWCDINTCTCSNATQPPLAGMPVTSNCSPAATCGQACYMRRAAKNLEDQADKCSEPWDLCWWTHDTDQLYTAAAQLETEAHYLEESARRMRARINAMTACCDMTDPTLQNIYGSDPTLINLDAETLGASQSACLNDVQLRGVCESKCPADTSVYSGLWAGLMRQIAFAKYTNCLNQCDTLSNSNPNGQPITCQDKLAAFNSELDAEINALTKKGQDLQMLAQEASGVVAAAGPYANGICQPFIQNCCTNGGSDPYTGFNCPDCNTGCANTCNAQYGNVAGSACIYCDTPGPGCPAIFHQSCYNAYYPGCYDNCMYGVNGCYTNCYATHYSPCYNQYRSTYCKTHCCSCPDTGCTIPWGRDCDTPDDNTCDHTQGGATAVPCGLSRFAVNEAQEANNQNDTLTNLQTEKANIQGCCASADPDACFENVLGA